MPNVETEWYTPSLAADGQPGTAWSSHREKPTGDHELMVQFRAEAGRSHLAECLYALADEAEQGHKRGKAANDAIFETKASCPPTRVAASLRALADTFDHGTGPV